MGSLDFPFEQTGDDYLKSAERDLQHNDNSGNINALTNSKRAIDCQLEALIAKYGLPKKKNFPDRTDHLRRIGLVAPRILEKVNKTRNFLEHEFNVPFKRSVVDGRRFNAALAPGSVYNFVYTLCTEPKNKKPAFAGFR